jgi:hypothetical protein
MRVGGAPTGAEPGTQPAFAGWGRGARSANTLLIEQEFD